jgi:hypothetical protein
MSGETAAAPRQRRSPCSCYRKTLSDGSTSHTRASATPRDPSHLEGDAGIPKVRPHAPTNSKAVLALPRPPPPRTSRSRGREQTTGGAGVRSDDRRGASRRRRASGVRAKHPGSLTQSAWRCTERASSAASERLLRVSARFAARGLGTLLSVRLPRNPGPSNRDTTPPARSGSPATRFRRPLVQLTRVCV